MIALLSQPNKKCMHVTKDTLVYVGTYCRYEYVVTPIYVYVSENYHNNNNDAICKALTVIAILLRGAKYMQNCSKYLCV